MPASTKPRTVDTRPSSNQTLTRGLAMMQALADGPLSLADLATRLGLAQSTTHRLAVTLVEHRYLAPAQGRGYRLGPTLLELGFRAQQETDLVQIARPRLEALADLSGDTVHLGVRDGHRALYLDKVPGRRRVIISSRVGDRHALTSTGLGKALLFDEAPDHWRALFDAERPGGTDADFAIWNARMTGYVAAGRAFDLEENEEQIRCVAAPVRDAGRRVVGALSVSSAAQYMDDARMATLADDVIAAADSISRELGWNPDAARPPRATADRRPS